MPSEIVRDITTLLLAIVGLGAFAIFVSKNSNSAGVINSGSSAFNTGLATAEGPVTGYNPGPPIYASSSVFAGELGSGFNTAAAA